MKHPADIVTVFRIIFSFALLFFEPFSILFITFYLICGLTDISDGLIARKTNTGHHFGAKLDSFADFIFFLICLYLLIPILDLSILIWIFIIFITAIKIFNQIFSIICYKQQASIHSFLNKITGIALFFFPLFYVNLNHNLVAIPLCLLAVSAAVNEFMIIYKGNYLVG